MKFRVMLVGMMVGLGLCMTTGAFGGFGMPSFGGGSSTASGDPDAYLAKAKSSEALVNKSADLLFALVASKEEQAKVEALRAELAKATSPEEKKAIIQKIQSSELAAISKAQDDKKLVAEAAKWDATKKQQGTAALYNLALGGKQAADLVPEGQNLAKSLQSNPMLATKVGSILDAVKSMGGITTGTAKVVTALPPVFSAAKIEAKLPSSSKSEPMPIQGGV